MSGDIYLLLRTMARGLVLSFLGFAPLITFIAGERGNFAFALLVFAGTVLGAFLLGSAEFKAS